MDHDDDLSFAPSLLIPISPYLFPSSLPLSIPLSLYFYITLFLYPPLSLFPDPAPSLSPSLSLPPSLSLSPPLPPPSPVRFRCLMLQITRCSARFPVKVTRAGQVGSLSLQTKLSFGPKTAAVTSISCLPGNSAALCIIPIRSHPAF